MKDKFCIDCKFHHEKSCWQPLAYVKPTLDLVSGKMTRSSWTSCADMRAGLCGRDAEFFVSKHRAFNELERMQLEEIYRMVS